MSRLLTSLGTGLVVASLVVSTASAQSRPRTKAPRAPEVETNGMIEHQGSVYERGVPYQEIGDYGDAWFVDQQPAHEVKLDAFYLDRNEVTVREYARFLTYAAGELHYNDDQPIDRVDDGFLPAKGTAEEPMRQVTWSGAKRYCQWAGKRLPTEAEWEFAASGEEGREYPWGEKGPNCERAVHFTGRAFCRRGPTATGAREPGATPNGVRDLAGNVAEWVRDRYGPYPEDLESPLDNPTGPESGQFRVVRGGGYLDSGKFLRSKARRAVDPSRHSENLGFRCALGVDEADSAGRDVRRGDLPLPSDEGRKTTERFPAPSADRAEIVSRAFETPDAMVAWKGDVYVHDDETGDLSRLAPKMGQPAVVVSDIGDLHDFATTDKHVYATVPSDGEVLRISPDGTVKTVVGGLTGPRPILVRSGELFLGTRKKIVRYDLEQDSSTTLVDGKRGFNELAFAGASTLFFGTDGDGNLDRASLGFHNLGSGQTSTILSSDQLGGRFFPSGIGARSSSATLYVTLRQEGFPRHGLLCQIDLSGSGGNCDQHTPPRPNHLAVGPTSLYWTSQRNLVSYDPDSNESFSFPGKWARIGGLALTETHVYWGDRHTGRIYRHPLTQGSP